jgi:CubicO group peptidase (beta-lactamase class C family)
MRTLFTLTLIACVLPFRTAEAQASRSADPRIQQVETGLMPGVLLKGHPIEHYSIEQRREHYHVVGLSIAVIEHYQIAWSKGYGVTNRQSQQPVGADTLFQAGSISKPVAAVAAMKLVQDGKLVLDQDVNGRLKSWHVPENEFTKTEKVTLRRLLSHSAGLTVHGFPGYAAGEPVPTVQQVLDGVKPANTAPVRVDTVPGSRFRYSGGGYTVMQLLLTETTGKPFAALLQDSALTPLGMTHSTYEQPLPAALRNQAAFAYEADGSPVPGDYHTYPEQAAAGLWTTAPDLARFGIEMQKSREGRSNKVLSEATTNLMLTRQTEDVGLSFFLEGTGAAERFGHGGANAGYQALMQFTLDGRGFVVMTNSDNGGRIAQEIAYSVASAYGWKDYAPKERTAIAVPAATLSALAGQYQIPNGPLLTIVASADHLQASFEKSHMDLYAETPEKYFALEPGIPDLTFSHDSQGRTELILGPMHIARK